MSKEYILGTHIRDGLRVGHTEDEVDALLRFIDFFDVKKFVEIGVHEGGLANVLLDIPNLYYLGIESNPSIVSELVQKRTTILGGDCFSSVVQTKVSYFINSLSGVSVVYCDNGNKPKELIAYAPIINHNDIIMGHDYYSPDRIVKGLEGFGTEDLEFPKPEVLPEDIKFLRGDSKFVEITHILLETRICGFMRI